MIKINRKDIVRQNMSSTLIELRKKKGFTQEKVANEVGISPSSYSQYELGMKVPRDDVKVRIAKFYNRSVQFIFFDSCTHSK